MDSDVTRNGLKRDRLRALYEHAFGAVLVPARLSLSFEFGVYILLKYK